MSRLNQSLAAALILLGVTSTEAPAELIISLGNATVAANGTGSVDIYATSTNGTDAIQAFSLDLRIAPVSGTNSTAQFSMTQADPFNHTDFLGSSDYVFAGVSQDQDSSPPSPYWSPLNTSNTINDSITGTDTYEGTGSVTISRVSPSYLGTVQFAVSSDSGTGNQFQVSLLNDNNTYFLTDQDDYGSTLGYTSTGGLVTVLPGRIISPATIPEPSTLTLSALGGLLAYLRSRSGRRKARAS